MDATHGHGRPRGTGLAGFALIFTLVASACGGGAATPAAATASRAPAATAAATAAATPAPATAAPKPADKITFITDFTAFGYVAPFYAGIEQGFFKGENIDLAVVFSQGSGDAAAKVAGGAAQFGLVDTITQVIAIAGGTPIVQVASHWQKHIGGLCTIQGKTTLKGFKDVEGKKIATTAGNAYIAILPFLMKQAGAKADSYQLVTMDAAASTTALLAGQVDATPCGYSTFASRALGVKAQGATLEFFAFANNGLDALGHGVVTTNALVQSNPALVQRFVNAYAKSVVWSALNVDKAVDAYMKTQPQQSREGEKGNYTAPLPFQVDPSAGDGGQFFIPPAKMQKTVELANSAYDKKVDAKVVFTNDFVNKLPAALRKGQLP